jgi:hypothetical protein
MRSKHSVAIIMMMMMTIIIIIIIIDLGAGTIDCTWWQSSAFDSHYPPKNGSNAVGWRVGSGWSVNPVCGDGEGDEWLATCGKVWLAEHPVSTAGAWIVLEN